MIIELSVKVPNSWLRVSFVDSITLRCSVELITDDDGFDIKIKSMMFPGWHAFNILADKQDCLHELIEQMAINEYAKKVEIYNHDDYVE